MPSLFTVCRDRKGKVIKPAPFQSSTKSGEVARVEPNKKWFGELKRRVSWSPHSLVPFSLIFQTGWERSYINQYCATTWWTVYLPLKLYFLFGFLGNTRVITQTALQTFQEEMGKAMKDPYKVTGTTHRLRHRFKPHTREMYMALPDRNRILFHCITEFITQ